MKGPLHIRLCLVESFSSYSISFSSLIWMMVDPGKTPVSRLCRRGMSSATNFGTRVSHRLLIKMFYSQSTVISEESRSFAFSDLLRLPAETKTDLRARSPKS